MRILCGRVGRIFFSGRSRVTERATQYILYRLETLENTDFTEGYYDEHKVDDLLATKVDNSDFFLSTI